MHELATDIVFVHLAFTVKQFVQYEAETDSLPTLSIRTWDGHQHLRPQSAKLFWPQKTTERSPLIVTVWLYILRTVSLQILAAGRLRIHEAEWWSQTNKV